MKTMKKVVTIVAAIACMATAIATPMTAKAATNTEIYVQNNDNNDVTAGVDYKNAAYYNSYEYRWWAYNESTGTWTKVQDWNDSQWLNWKPDTYGKYVLQGDVGQKYTGYGSRPTDYGRTEITYHPNIKGKCQMPYDGGGFLIGVESYDNPNNAYSYELLVLDCTKLAAGDPAPWIYTSGRQTVPGNNFWTIWQPQYGYYWTLFRVYDANGNLIDEDCYGFANTDSGSTQVDNQSTTDVYRIPMPDGMYESGKNTNTSGIGSGTVTLPDDAQKALENNFSGNTITIDANSLQ